MKALVNITTGDIIATSMQFKEKRIKELTGIQTGLKIGRIPNSDFSILEIEYITHGTQLSYQTEFETQPVYKNEKVIIEKFFVDIPLENAKSQAWEKVKNERNAVISHIPYQGNWYQADSESRTNLDGARSLLGSPNGPGTIDWVTSDNKIITHNATSLEELWVTGAEHIALGHAYAQSLRIQIEEATTVDEIRSLDITVGWPDRYIII